MEKGSGTDELAVHATPKHSLGQKVLRWLGILAASIWIFEAATGIVLAYHFELNDALISEDRSELSYDAISVRMSEIEAAGGDAKVNWIWSTAGLPGRFLMNYTAADGDVRMARLAGDGSVLVDTVEDKFTFLEKIRDLHLALGTGDVGERILAVAGLVLLLNLVVAFVSVLNRSRIGSALERTDLGAQRSQLTRIYRAMTLWGAVPAFIVVLAAVVIYFEHDIEGPIGAPPISLAANPPTGEGVSFAVAARAAEAAMAGSRFVGTTMPTAEDATYKAWVNQPGEYFREDGYGGSLVLVDANDGSIRGAWPLQEASLPYKLIALPYPVHTGEILRGLGRFLVLLIGTWLLIWSALRIILPTSRR